MTAQHPLTSNRMQSIHLTPKLDKVLAVGNTGKLACWNAIDGEELGVVPDSADANEIETVHITNFGRKAVVVYRNGKVVVRGIPKLEPLASVELAIDSASSSSLGSQLLAVALAGMSSYLMCEHV